ncbi:class GN sortase [Gilvimarinus sp. F26214L]|uniref:class GN sortase n=1 Tax=Gilvimarinus sp. DZF01 TaxID=3461371 RepID=UPI0040467949
MLSLLPSTYRRALLVLLILLAAVSGGQALYLSGKAWLAQQLLHSAWKDSEARAQPVKPWPWADVHPAGLLTVDRLGIEQIVLSDHSGEALAFGPGAAQAGDALVLAGHRDSHFAFLRNLQPGDRIKWQARDQSSEEYRVTSMEVLDIRVQEQIVPDPNTLLLITCYPFDTLSAGGPLRFAVVAQKISRL